MAEKLILLVSKLSHPYKDLIAATLCWLAKEKNAYFDVYYTSERQGVLFAPHGSFVISGYHRSKIADALACFDTYIFRLDKTNIFDSILARGGKKIMDSNNILNIYKTCSEILEINLPGKITAVQTKNLPENFKYGISQYIYPEITFRKTLAFPLELPIAKLTKQIKIEKCFLIIVDGTDFKNWEDLNPEIIDRITPDDDYKKFSLRILNRWRDKIKGVDFCEPVLSSEWLPYSAWNNRIQVIANNPKELVNEISEIANKTDKVVYCRYAGGYGAVKDDRDFFDYSRRNISIHVVEPTRPVLRVFSQKHLTLPKPEKKIFDFEPTEEQLKKWAKENKILISLIFHSGELSHYDAVLSIIDLVAWKKVKVGLAVMLQRYQFSSEVMELTQVPVNEGGVLGLAEPLLHSSGYGIIAEKLANVLEIKETIKSAKEKITEISNHPVVGYYPYLDANPEDWSEPADELWDAIKDIGFEYIISSVSPGKNRLLYRKDNFVVINQTGKITYPYSPFVRIHSAKEIEEFEENIISQGKPGWIIGVLDSPVHGYMPYIWSEYYKKHEKSRLIDIFDYIVDSEKNGKIISVLPHTIAKYAKII